MPTFHAYLLCISLYAPGFVTYAGQPDLESHKSRPEPVPGHQDLMQMGKPHGCELMTEPASELWTLWDLTPRQDSARCVVSCLSRGCSKTCCPSSLLWLLASSDCCSFVKSLDEESFTATLSAVKPREGFPVLCHQYRQSSCTT